MYQVLLVEDDPQIREVIEDYIGEKAKNELELFTVVDGEQAMQILKQKSFDLLLLDVMLPDIDGFTLCRIIREKSETVPIIFLTAKGSEQDVLRGYGLGCDDYVVKPFSLATLHAKILAVLRRVNQQIIGADEFENNEILCAGNIKVNLGTCQAYVYNAETLRYTEIVLQSKQYDILRYLMEHKNRVISRQVMLDEVWGYDYIGTDRIVDNQIKLLRKSLGQAGYQIKTVISKGYKLEE